MKTLQGKTAVITGAGSGIGRSIALALAKAGTNVVVADIQAASAEAVAAQVRQHGVRALAVTADVARRASVAELADRSYAEFDAVDILCNNAGVSWRPFRTVMEATMEDWKFIMEVNLWGVVHGLDVFLPRMRAQPGDKHIVNTASQAGLLPLAGHTPYSASKAAVACLSEAIAQELAPHGFGVTILCPGFVRTSVTQNSELLRPESERGAQRTFEPFSNPLLDRLATLTIGPEDVGRIVCNGILEGALYLHTQALPEGIPEWRTEVLFGPKTLGHAGPPATTSPPGASA